MCTDVVNRHVKHDPKGKDKNAFKVTLPDDTTEVITGAIVLLFQ